MKLEQLRELGAVPSSLDSVRVLSDDLITVTTFQQLSEEERAANRKVVVLDNYEWIATTKRRPAKEASAVYSCAGEVYGCWRKEKGFSYMRLSNGSLVTTKRVEVPKKLLSKEDKSMAGLGDVSTQPMNFDLDSLNEGMDASASASTGEKVSKTSEMNDRIRGIRSKITASVTDRSKAQINNRKYGRLLFFITKTNSAIRLGKKSVPVLDANGKRQVDKSQATDEQLKKLEGSNNQPPLSICVKSQELLFRQVKPGQVVGVALRVPAGSDISLTDVAGEAEKKIDISNDNTMVTHLLSKEQAFDYLAANFDGKIMEDEKTVGAKASEIMMDVKIRKKVLNKATGVSTDIVVADFKLKDRSKRKTVLTEGNYFPIRMYKTMRVDNLSDEDKKAMNLHFKNLIKSQDDYKKFGEATKKRVTMNPDGTFTSSWFNEGEQIQVTKYDAVDDNDVVTDVAIPVRTEKLTKKGDKMTYPYQYIELGEEGGSQQKYARFIQETGMAEADFIEKVKSFAKANRKSSKTQKEVFTANDWLGIRLSNSLKTTTETSLQELAAQIELGA